MAKQARRQQPPSLSKDARNQTQNTRTPSGHRAEVSPTAAADDPQYRSSYLEAVALYEQAVQTLQQRDFPRAAELLGQVVRAYSQEKELVERARLYLGLCERHIRPPDAEPQSISERLYAATLALNAAEIDRAIGYLERVLEDDRANDRALYMLASAYAARGQVDLAIGYLQRAIATNPENRALARTDPDLESLRSDEAVAALLEGPILPVDRRRTDLSRSGR
jgi:tetratricopeptide (TPR) repeat protein